MIISYSFWRSYLAGRILVTFFLLWSWIWHGDRCFYVNYNFRLGTLPLCRFISGDTHFQWEIWASSRRKVWKKKTLQEGELSCVDNHGVRGLKQRWEIYRAWTFVPCMDKTTGTQNSRARRDFPHAAKKNEMLSCVDSHLRTWTTPMDRDKTPCVEKIRRTKCYPTWTRIFG